MNLKRTLTLAVVGAAATAWLYAAVTSGPREILSLPVEKGAVDARGEALATEVARLHERLRPTATPRQPARNLFQFTAARPQAQPVTRPALTEAAPVAVPPPLPFKLIGIAENPGPGENDGPVRTAIVSAPGQLFLVKVGDAVTLRYRVTKISTDVLELIDLADNSTQRLALR